MNKKKSSRKNATSLKDRKKTAAVKAMKQENLVDERRQSRRVIRGKISFSPQFDLSENVNSHHFIENLSCKRSIFKSSKIRKIKHFQRTNKLIERSESLEKLAKKLNIKEKGLSFVIYT